MKTFIKHILLLTLVIYSIRSSATTYFITITEVIQYENGFRVLWTDNITGTLTLTISNNPDFNPIFEQSSCSNCNNLTILNSMFFNPGGKFYIRVSGASTQSSVWIDYTIPSQPSSITSSTNCTSIGYSWTDNNPQHTYTYEFDDNSNFSSPISTSTVTGSSKSFSDLSPSTTYYFRLKAITPSTFSPWEYASNFTASTIPAPTSLTSSNETSTSFIANWGSVGCATDGYDIDVLKNIITHVSGYPKHVTSTSELVDNLTSCTYFFKVRAKNGSTNSAWSSLKTVNLADCRTTDGNLGNQTSLNLSIYPNPTRDILRLSLRTESIEDINFQIIDTSGRILQFGSTSSDIPLDVSKLESGIYFIKLKAGELTKTERFVKE